MPVKVGLQYIDIWQESMEDEVLAYEREPLHKGQIVFYGPSYFTRWSTRFGMIPMREVLLGKSGAQCVVNRGFGSSCAEHQLYYYARMIRPLEPKVLVYTFFGNGPSFGYSDEESWELAQRVIAWARTDFPDIRIYLLGAQRSVSTTPEDLAKKRVCNAWVKEFAENTPNCFYLETLDYAPLDRQDIFVEDGVHFNQEGYHIFGDFFKEALKTELEQY